MPEGACAHVLRRRRALALLLSLFCGCRARSTATDAGAGSIEHLVVLLQENHSFDSYFGLYCTGQGAFPSPCAGRSCCERAPQMVPGRDDLTTQSATCAAYPPFLDDAYNQSGDPPHHADTE